MLKIAIRILKGNKVRSFFCFLGVFLASALIFSVSFLFSSFRDYLIKGALKSANYHVFVETSFDIKKSKSMESISFKDGRYFIKFKNIYDTYLESEKICELKECNIVYNDKLLALYGMSDNKSDLDAMRKILITLLLVLGVTLFFIIYNSFKVCLFSRKKEIALFKGLSISDFDLKRLFFLEGTIISLFGILFGFIFSLFFSNFVIFIINNLLDEILDFKIVFSFYLEFLFISFVFILFILLFSIVLPFRFLKKYDVMSLFHEDFPSTVKFKNYIFTFGMINYKRNFKRYRSIIFCIFLFCLLFNFVYFILNYTNKIVSEYVVNFDYDLKVISDNDVSFVSEDLKASKSLMFRFCEVSSDYNYFVTDLGGDNYINLFYDSSKKMIQKTRVLSEIPLKASSKIPFGFRELLTKDNVVVNLSSEKFSKACSDFQYNLFLNTSSNINEYVKNKDFDYFNVKKVRALTNNVLLAFKIVFYGILFFILFVSITTIFNVLFLSMDFRRKEFALFKSLGISNSNIYLILFMECFILVFKGFFLSLPFVFILNRVIYDGLCNFYSLPLTIPFNTLVFSFVFCLCYVYFVMFICYLRFCQGSIIYNIRY